MAAETVDFRQGKELGAEIIRAMQDWSAGTETNARVVLIALLDALLKSISGLPKDRQEAIAREFAAGLFQHLGIAN